MCVIGEVLADCFFRNPNEKYLIFESSHCGVPINRNQVKNAWAAVSIITQLASALAAAELAFDYEHRDLHFGNLLVKRCEDLIRYNNGYHDYYVRPVGLKVYVIDFTYSKIRLGMYLILQNCHLY
ncbi:hypothetical protein AVEN_69469-1 [Araneus ventricosus]|uniref:Protein kinase domain-containing protein n=1 Tax=Araneus ventricosus TaxID=182803 RepID=A0A4Y2IA23_ARAVE|nr:hypothetical protein AVEN_69469-1 [Araneus ventricosus]